MIGSLITKDFRLVEVSYLRVCLAT